MAYFERNLGNVLSNQPTNLSLAGVINHQLAPTNTTDNDPTAMSVNQCAPIIRRGREKMTVISSATPKAVLPK